MSDKIRRHRTVIFVSIVVVAWLVRELVIWLGYSWVAGTIIGVATVIVAFAFLSRRASKH
jgi:Kef-type K+ transport system membrane component KefB